MTGRGLLGRAFAVLVAALVAVLAGLTLSPASATEDPEKVKVAIGRSDIIVTNPNAIPIDITLTDPETKKAPVTRYGVFLNARQGDDESILDAPELCVQQHDADPDVPAGIYRCSIIVNNPGAWTFTGYVNLPTNQGQRQLQTVETTLTIDDAVVLAGEFKGLKYIVEGSSFDVFLLQAHMALASLWLLLVAALTFVAVPRLRAMLSVLALHTIEVRRGFLTSAMWTAFGATLITGTYLLNTQTAYTAPFSTSRFSFSDYDAITRLPYASVYFNALYLKILIFLVMGGASMVLSMEAGRAAQAAQDAQDATDGPDDEVDMWGSGVHFDEQGHVLHDPAVSGSVIAARRTRPAVVAMSSRTMWACVAIMAGGTGVIGLCVTILKYCHELIETANAARILGG